MSAPEQSRVGALRSLRDLMERIRAADLIPLTVSMAQMIQITSYDKDDHVATDALKAWCVAITNVAIRASEMLSLRESAAMGRRLLEEFNWKLKNSDVKNSLFHFLRLMESEMEKEIYITLSSDEAKYFEQGALFGASVDEGFPTARADIREAGSCYALGRNTACVHHCMRALEPALKGLADNVGASFGSETWHVVIEDIESRVRALGKALPRGVEKSERLQVLAEACKEFVWFKDGWRNYAAHGKTPYDALQALSVLNHTKAFMQTLAHAGFNDWNGPLEPADGPPP